MTPPAVDKLSTGPVAGVLPEAATLTGSLAPNGFDTHYFFEWGATTSYGNSSPEPPGVDAGAAKGTAAAETSLAGLTPNTTYHYRLVASNSFGTTFGADQQFTTSGPPRITIKPANDIGHEVATINAEVNPDQLETTYRFEYGKTTEYGSEAPIGGKGIGKGATAVSVSAALGGLELGVTYHYRLSAANTAGTRVSPDRTFTTVPPALITSYANRVSPTEATLNAEVNPLGNDTRYYFEYGAGPCAPDAGSCAVSPASPGEDIGAGTEPVLKTLSLSGLEPNTTYHYRVVAANALGIAEGIEHAVTTPKPASTFALPDGRAWEMVTPPDKEGAPIESLTREGGIILAAHDGNALTYVADGTIGEAEGNRTPEMQQFLANRGSERWANRDLATPSTQAKGITAGQSPEYQYFSRRPAGSAR